jgi:hypothetical protein
MEHNMKLRFDVYTNNIKDAKTAFSDLTIYCKDLTLSKGKRYNSDTEYYNVYGCIDTADIAVLHDAFSGSFVDDSCDL